jgi:hypothetical protein
MFISATVHAYDTGALNCNDIGELAAQTMAAKRAGTPFQSHLASLANGAAERGAVERKLIDNIARLIYENELLEAMRPADAYMVFMSDCRQGKGEDDEAPLAVRHDARN